MNKLVIIGAGGHGKVIADNALKNGYTNICFIDDRLQGSCVGFPIVGTCADIMTLDDGNTDFIIGIGNNGVRKAIAEKYSVNWITLIHPSAQVSHFVTVEKGTVIMAGAAINAGACIGEHCIINTGAVVEHDNVIEGFVHLSPRVALGGTVTVGSQTHVGIGAVVKNDVAICGDCIIGAGATVVKNITDAGIYIGSPARKNR